MNIDVAVGEVPWERSLLAALADHSVADVGKRYVDLAMVPDDGGVVLVCPSIRGCSETQLRRLALRRQIVVLQDTIRPPWLANSGLPVYDVDAISFPELIGHCLAFGTAPQLHVVPSATRGRITAFAGVSGGVGVTTLTWLFAQGYRDSLVIDGNLGQPGLAMLSGNGRPPTTLAAAARALRHDHRVELAGLVSQRPGEPSVLALPVDGSDICPPDELGGLLVAAATQYPHVIVDAGQMSHLHQAQLLKHIDTLMIVTVATPLGLVRLCAQHERWRTADVRVVVNRVRASVAGSRHVATAIRNFVRSELDCEPLFVPDHPADCDRGWLTGEWGPMAGVVQDMQLRQSA